MTKQQLVVITHNLEDCTFSLHDLAELCQIADQALLEWLANEVISPEFTTSGLYRLDVKQMRRMRIARRINRDFDINGVGLALVLDLLEEVDDLRAKNTWMERHLLRR